jgi:anti-sigma factor RsiW
MTDHERYADWDGAYVLDALTPAEREEFERHLAVCTECRRTVAELLPLPGLLRRVDEADRESLLAGSPPAAPPAGLEDRLRAHPLISQCMVIGDGRPFIAALITIDEEAWPAWLAAHGHPAGTSVADLRDDDGLRAEIQQAVDDANRSVSRAEAIKVFRILPRDWTEATGELTPSLKVRRSVVLKEHADEISAIYPG